MAAAPAIPLADVSRPFDEFAADGGKTLASRQHPVQVIQETWKRNEKLRKHQVLARTMGMHMPIKLQMEEFVVTQNHVPRLAATGGMTEIHSLELLNSFDDELGFEDFLGQARDSEVSGIKFYAQMESHFHITPPTRI